MKVGKLLARDFEKVLRSELSKHGRKLAETLRPYDINEPTSPFERVRDAKSPFCVAQRKSFQRAGRYTPNSTPQPRQCGNTETSFMLTVF